MHTREIAHHLSNYASLLYAESYRQEVVGTVSDDEVVRINASRLEREADKIRDMANELYNMKKEM